MKKLQKNDEVRAFLRQSRACGDVIGIVPTMGALHAGHRALIQAARAECDVVVVSVFVNPTQFGPNEDFESYPRPLEDDLAACEAEGVDAVFVPEVAEMYDALAATHVHVARLTEGLCGQHRPDHFDGVTTVVTKLFNIVEPERAYFGQKDAQQVAVIRKMTRDLCWPIDIVTCPTVREPDGLALSSRNVYLSADQRQQAVVLSRSLREAKETIESGERNVAKLVRAMRAKIEEAGACEIDYVEIVDGDELTPMSVVEGRCLMALAVRIGRTRLIDNLMVDATQSGG